ncbi:hypothetical protein BJ170DRAFT_276388 [Xylariales sp. AK1849]|nr:hypothetical protein BJ170DRAFT_276388 [Xylariales sp. AK1849]
MNMTEEEYQEGFEAIEAHDWPPIHGAMVDIGSTMDAGVLSENMTYPGTVSSPLPGGSASFGGPAEPGNTAIVTSSADGRLDTSQRSLVNDIEQPMDSSSPHEALANDISPREEPSGARVRTTMQKNTPGATSNQSVLVEYETLGNDTGGNSEINELTHGQDEATDDSADSTDGSEKTVDDTEARAGSWYSSRGRVQDIDGRAKSTAATPKTSISRTTALKRNRVACERCRKRRRACDPSRPCKRCVDAGQGHQSMLRRQVVLWIDRLLTVAVH